MPKSTASKPEPASNQPLFYSNPVPISQQRHAKAGLQMGENYAFAAKTNSIMVTVVEFVEAAKHYPIVFAAESKVPVAVLGLEQDNYFVDKDGVWQPHAYIPAYVRKYPFIFMQVPEKDQLLLCVDEDSQRFKASGGKGTLPFYEKEEPSQLIKVALEITKQHHQHTQITEQFIKVLDENGLLKPNSTTFTLKNGKQMNLGGFLMIDEEKFRALPDDKVLELHKKGWMPFIYFALMSTSNWRNLADIAAAREAKREKVRKGK